MEDLTQVDPWPLDVSALQKGRTITQAECETAVGVSATHARYPFELMRLREHIMQASDRAGTPLSVAIRGNALVINTDAEAAAYHHKLAKQSERAIHRNLHHLRRTVDPSTLTADERRQWERNVQLWSMKMARMKGRKLEHDTNQSIEGPG
jgi:hypothetical protein